MAITCGSSNDIASKIKHFRSNDKCPKELRDKLRKLPYDDANSEYFGPDAMTMVVAHFDAAADAELIKAAMRGTTAYKARQVFNFLFPAVAALKFFRCKVAVPFLTASVAPHRLPTLSSRNASQTPPSRPSGTTSPPSSLTGRA